MKANPFLALLLGMGLDPSRPLRRQVTYGVSQKKDRKLKGPKFTAPHAWKKAARKAQRLARRKNRR